MEVRGISGQNDYSSWRIRLWFVGVEFVSKADIENTGYDRVNAVLGVSMRL